MWGRRGLKGSGCHHKQPLYILRQCQGSLNTSLICARCLFSPQYSPKKEPPVLVEVMV